MDHYDIRFYTSTDIHSRRRLSKRVDPDKLVRAIQTLQSRGFIIESVQGFER